MREPGPGMRIARPFGIPVFISPYWFLIAGVFVILYARGLDASVAANLRYVVAAAFVVLLYASVLVHELSHSLVALAFGLPVRRILLYPLGGFSEIEREPPTPGREFLVSAAAPPGPGVPGVRRRPADLAGPGCRGVRAGPRVPPGRGAGGAARPAGRREPAGRGLQLASGPAPGRRPDAPGGRVEADRPAEYG